MNSYKAGNNFKAVIFDFGGVFTTSPVEHFAAFERQHNLPDRFIGSIIKKRIDDGPFAQYERAEISFDEFNRLFSEETKAAGFEISGKTFIGFLDVALKPAMIAALQKVKGAGYQTGCITNNFPNFESDGSTRAKMRKSALEEIFSLFDEVIESSQVGIRKPEPRIYKMMCERLSTPAQACIFLDDLGINLKPAKVLGMTTIKVPFGDVSPAIAELGGFLGIDLEGET